MRDEYLPMFYSVQGRNRVDHFHVVVISGMGRMRDGQGATFECDVQFVSPRIPRAGEERHRAWCQPHCSMFPSLGGSRLGFCDQRAAQDCVWDGTGRERRTRKSVGRRYRSRRVWTGRIQPGICQAMMVLRWCRGRGTRWAGRWGALSYFRHGKAFLRPNRRKSVGADIRRSREVCSQH